MTFYRLNANDTVYIITDAKEAEKCKIPGIIYYRQGKDDWRVCDQDSGTRINTMVLVSAREAREFIRNLAPELIEQILKIRESEVYKAKVAWLKDYIRAQNLFNI